MLEHGRPHFRPLDLGHIDFDLKWRFMDVHEVTICIFFFRGYVRGFTDLMPHHIEVK